MLSSAVRAPTLHPQHWGPGKAKGRHSCRAPGHLLPVLVCELSHLVKAGCGRTERRPHCLLKRPDPRPGSGDSPLRPSEDTLWAGSSSGCGPRLPHSFLPAATHCQLSSCLAVSSWAAGGRHELPAVLESDPTHSASVPRSEHTSCPPATGCPSSKWDLGRRGGAHSWRVPPSSCGGVEPQKAGRLGSPDSPLGQPVFSCVSLSPASSEIVLS